MRSVEETYGVVCSVMRLSELLTPPGPGILTACPPPDLGGVRVLLGIIKPVP